MAIKLPDPVPGLVVRFNYLWYADRFKGLSEGEKDRPCAIVISSKTTGMVTVVPITHSPPDLGEEHLSMEIPPELCKEIGLDDGGNYVRLGETNRFEWPGDNLKPLPQDSSRVHYGTIPKDFFDEVRKRLADMARQQSVKLTKR